MLILVSGLPASGKSYFAKALSEKLAARYLSSDIIRSQMALRGQYDGSTKKLVYKEMLGLAEQCLVDGDVVILDATFYVEEVRFSFIQLAKKMHFPLAFIVIKAHEETIAERMKRKRKYSEADFEVYLKLKEQYEPIEQTHLTLWSDRLTLEEMMNKALDYLELNQRK